MQRCRGCVGVEVMGVMGVMGGGGAGGFGVGRSEAIRGRRREGAARGVAGVGRGRGMVKNSGALYHLPPAPRFCARAELVGLGEEEFQEIGLGKQGFQIFFLGSRRNSRAGRGKDVEHRFCRFTLRGFFHWGRKASRKGTPRVATVRALVRTRGHP